MTSPRAFFILMPLLCAALAGCSTGTPDSVENRPFFQKEQATETHGRKTWFDHVVEFDPGGLSVDVAPDYDQHPPAVIAVMPFTDRGSAQYTVDKIPLTFRNEAQRNEWAWTDAQRLRKAYVGYLSQREFTVVNPIGVDAVLKQHSIDDDTKLRSESVLTLGKWFQCDAIVLGQVNHYEAFYFGPVSGYVVGVDSRMISTHDGETLMRTSGSRYSVDFLPAMDLQDIAINSAEALLQLRDVELARAEEEVARELVLRIPQSETLKSEMAESAIKRADQNEEDEEEALNEVPLVDGITEDLPITAPSPQSVAQRSQSTVDQPPQPPKTASSWHRHGGRYASYSSQ